MKLSGREVLVCDCGASMDIDAKGLGKACGAADGCNVATSLCRGEIGQYEAALAAAGTTPLIVACTQEAAVFSAIAEDEGLPVPDFVNIRESAGWSDDGAATLPKIAALLKAATDQTPAARSLTLTSDGRCLIYADGARGSGVEAAMKLAAALKDDLGVTVMITNAGDDIMASADCGLVTRGTISKASGHFTAFDLVVDGFAPAHPASRSLVSFEDPEDGVETGCDIIIDITGGTPLFTGWEKRDGYLRADAEDKVRLESLAATAAEMIGEFEKPIYVSFDADLCAHSRNSLSGCSRCLDVCPAGAITSIGDTVDIDPAICGGCGFCGAVCPSGAAQTEVPAADSFGQRMASLLDHYLEAGGKRPRLLLADETYGAEMVGMIARFGSGLPADMLAMTLHSVGRAGHDLMVTAIAQGFEQVVVLTNPAKADEAEQVTRQAELAQALLAGIGGDDPSRIVIVDESDPDKVDQMLRGTRPAASLKAAPFSPIGSPRGITRLAMRGLAKQAKMGDDAIPLPEGAPYGRVDIDTGSCTICLSCVGACPAGALQDNPDAPQLLFREDACLQCGICVATCPEKVISLVPQFNLADSAMTAEMVIEDTPFHCTGCGKPFGSTRSIERVIDKLSGHSMFTGSNQIDMLKMCEDCRVEVMFDKDDRLMDVGERRKPRTTDDYLN
ncbi:MAG: 4Fe-4S dicluster domain-containing protein [Candidatus Puniceispirillaceae bacterium]